ncbi:aldo/keto reductase [Kitasatospora paracochleata]|uniref:Aryl-alcohol dehydrogenase-like predicted oxidoreductase n=2 Tax=Kitasatospora paracochleata TaxID=58354 RepID=A0ABT1IVJ5_9ACTN|nr:aryl-alcohol dehydrogenase-like predicted oxidoreductase [Kitasatospora paracochleata]
MAVSRLGLAASRRIRHGLGPAVGKEEVAGQLAVRVLPFAMLTNAFVPTGGMPGRLAATADRNPVTAAGDRTRRPGVHAGQRGRCRARVVAMEYTHLGRTGLTVSRLCLGTMNFGPHTDEPNAHAIMDAAHEHGINFFDTANVYGWGANKGLTETIIGNWFAKGGGRREKTVIATKLYGDMGEWPNEGRLSALNIRRAVDASLRRLQTDHIDLYQMHHIDRATPWEEIWQAMEVLTAQGKIIYVGSSNFAGWHIAQAQEAARARNFLGLTSEQSLYNLLERSIEREVVPAAQHYGLGLIPWSPLHGGLLGGVLRKEREGVRRTMGRSAETLEAKREQLQAYEDLAAEVGHEPGDIALAWLLSRPAVTAPIVGPRTAEQLHAAVRALSLHLDQKTLDRLDEIFPGHRTAPEDYAW